MCRQDGFAVNFRIPAPRLRDGGLGRPSKTCQPSPLKSRCKDVRYENFANQETLDNPRPDRRCQRLVRDLACSAEGPEDLLAWVENDKCTLASPAVETPHDSIDGDIWLRPPTLD